MQRISEKIDPYLEIVEATYRIPRRWIAAIILFPLFIDCIALVFLRLDVTRQAARWMLAENHPVEMFTFVILMLATGWALVLSRQAMRSRETAWVYCFYAVFAVCLLLVGMEEISWGQQLFRFDTFGAFREVNRQGEVNFHNIGSLQGNSAYFRLVYGLGGLLGVWLSLRYNWWRKITPSPVLLTWFVVITFFATLGVVKNLTGYTGLYYAFSLRDLSELNEMLIGLSSFLFIWLQMRKLQLEHAMKSSIARPDGIIKQAVGAGGATQRQRIYYS